MHYKRLFAALSALMLLTAPCCHRPPKHSSAIPSKRRATGRPTKVEKAFRITDSNVVSFLSAYGKAHPQTLVAFTTTLGSFKIRLYRDTPLHRANFIYLVNHKYFEGTYFHRVVKGFVDQAGNTDMMKTFIEKQRIGHYSLPAEFSAKHLHQRGAVSMARGYVDNPQKRSTPFEFFVVIGKRYTAAQLREYEAYYKLRYTPYQKRIYETLGGAPNLDGEHTVFGVVVDGMRTLIEINQVKTEAQSQSPLQDVVITKTEVMS